MAATATAHRAIQAAITWRSAQGSISWSARTTRAATPAPSSQLARALEEVAGLGAWAAEPMASIGVRVEVFIVLPL